jgi:DNA-binding response OmpR family regulator
MQNLRYTHNILILEGNIEIANVIYNILRQNESYRIYKTHLIKQALKYTNKLHFDLICLDMMLSDGSGLDFCNMLKQDFAHKSTKIIIVSNRKLIESKTQAFENGIDDYITKPFHPKEIDLRVKHHLGLMIKAHPQINFKQFSLDTIQMHLIYYDYKLPLTQTEFLVLKYLFEHNGIANADVLSKFLSSKKFKYVDNTSVIVSIKRLRDKLKRNTGNPFIKTRYGAGYYIP